ncbi:hypothetical protein DFH09DRAFT_913967 [Mycena vulgaris]|nr:hypothetical protein DFH09DRAFT_913967 [Mycena vulgaris]
MNKSQFYLSQCVDAASKSTMYYKLGAVLVKGGKVISTGHNHQRPNYEAPRHGKPLSMHAEMACIFNATRGRAPALKQQVQPGKRTATPETTRKRDGATEKQEARNAASGGATQGVRGSSRHSKLNGADLYVCRVIKRNGGEFGSSKPCWRCVDWCAWAGIRRIFHYSMDEGRFVCVKVGASGELYQTIADTRILTAR